MAIICSAVLSAAVISNPPGLRIIWERLTAPDMVTVAVPDEHNIESFTANPLSDADKASSIHGAMLQTILTQDARTTGTSPESIHLTFEAPAEIVGIAVSVDISSDMSIVEVAAGINDERGYGQSRTADWLIHTSYAASDIRSGKIDESVWYGSGEGFAVKAGDHVAVGAWLSNVATNASGISPEVVVYYRWLE